MSDWDRFVALTFDCYGTLIDWETGIINGLRPVLSAHNIDLSDDELLETYAELETFTELSIVPICEPMLTYKEVLTIVLFRFAQKYGFQPTPEEMVNLRNSLKDWPAFPDSAESLKALKEKFKLGVLSNVDDNLFAYSNLKLKVNFDWVITAEQVGSYKPTHRNFEVMLERLQLPKERILHVAQSLHHDHKPAKDLGFTTFWIDRRKNVGGFGATAPQKAEPDFEAPDMKTFTEIVLS
jgi:2-haloacid dehalogenase